VGTLSRLDLFRPLQPGAGDEQDRRLRALLLLPLVAWMVAVFPLLGAWVHPREQGTPVPGLEGLYRAGLVCSGVGALVAPFWHFPLWGVGTSLLLVGLLALSSPRRARLAPRPDPIPHPTVRQGTLLLLSAALGVCLVAVQLIAAQYLWLIVRRQPRPKARCSPPCCEEWPMEGIMMFVIVNRFKVNAGYEDMFEELSLHRAHLVECMPGFFKWELHRPLGDGWYASITYWESRQHHDVWQRSDAYKIAHHEKPPEGMFAAPNVLEMTEVVQSSYSPQAFLDAMRHVLSESDEVM
jgi:heme-degrading monooxygenase HmoA